MTLGQSLPSTSLQTQNWEKWLIKSCAAIQSDVNRVTANSFTWGEKTLKHQCMLTRWKPTLLKRPRSSGEHHAEREPQMCHYRKVSGSALGRALPAGQRRSSIQHSWNTFKVVCPVSGWQVQRACGHEWTWSSKSWNGPWKRGGWSIFWHMRRGWELDLCHLGVGGGGEGNSHGVAGKVK